MQESLWLVGVEFNVPLDTTESKGVSIAMVQKVK